MSPAVVDPRHESNALRRVALLLERLRQDGLGSDPDLALVRSGIDALRRAATDGHSVQRATVSELAANIAARVALLPRGRSVSEIVRSSVFVETDELLRRLAAS